MMRFRRVIQASFLLVGWSLLSGCAKKNADDFARPIRSAVVETSQPEKRVRISANVLPSKQIDLSFRVEGYVQSTYRIKDPSGAWRELEPGDVVQEGTVLATVRATDYQSRSDVLLNQVGEARAAYASAQSQLSEEIAARDLAKIEFERAKVLFGSDAMTKSDFDQASSAYDKSEARVAEARAQVSYQQARIDAAVAARKEATAALEDTFLRAPFSGVVVARKIDLGSLVMPGSTAFVLADLHNIKLAFGIPDLELKKIKIGQLVPISVDAIPGIPFAGRITSISPSADPLDREYTVELTVPNQNNALKAYMIATVQLSTATQDNPTPTIPLSAIVHTNSRDGFSVYVLEPKGGTTIARLRTVKLGKLYGGRVAVTQGLSPGEHVAEDGGLQLANGAHVKELQVSE
jgi:multidrug efflux pump subunit AcrA (membrane-fusion protein)